MKRQKITILGATGSIGLSALDVIERHPERFEVIALSACTQKEKLLLLCQKHQPRFAVLMQEDDSIWLRECLGRHSTTVVLTGEQALNQIASTAEVDTVISAIVGAVGAMPTFAAARAGKRILLSNKETIVMAGDLFFTLARQNKATILPVDSEHNAIFQVFPQDKSTIKQLILTASGGPFLSTPIESLVSVTPQEALDHPNWKMGRKISVDSATMMNKALEVIEARWFFDIPGERIEVLIHPQSVIHSLIRLVDESVLAQLGVSDIRIALEYCLAYPERIVSGAYALALDKCSPLSFEQVDLQRFPALTLAYEVLKMGKDAACILNAANEVAVALFLDEKIAFTDIYALVVRALTDIEVEEASSLEALLEKDRMVRAKTTAWAKNYCR